MNTNEETIILNGQEVVINHTPVHMYDDTGNDVGMGTLNDVIQKGLWCRSVHIWIINKKGELYLHQRSLKVLNNPGKWGESCGGYIDEDMTPLETAQEETKEEIGLILDASLYQNLGVIKQYEPRPDGLISQQLVTVYLVEYDLSEDEITLCKRDVIQGTLLHWKQFTEQLEKKEIDFVDHQDEIALVLGVISKKY